MLQTLGISRIPRTSPARRTSMPATCSTSIPRRWLPSKRLCWVTDASSRSELCVCDIARLLGLTESAVSHQLRLLRGMRLVRPRRAGRMVFYSLDDHHIVGLFAQGLEHVEE